MLDNTQRCCIKGCDSDECGGTKSIGSFQFPIHDATLLKKWLRQIDLPHWKPGVSHRICGMHFQPNDILCRPNDEQPRLRLSSIPTIFPSYPVEVVNLNAAKPEDPPTKLPANFVNLVGDARAIQARPVFLINARYPLETVQFPSQMVMRNAGQTSVNNSLPISAGFVKQIGAGDSRMPLRSSAQLIERISVPSYQTFRLVNRSNIGVIPQIGAESAARFVVQSRRPILAPIPAGFSERVPPRSLAEIGEKPPRLRKILPKPQSFDPATLPVARNPRKPRTETTKNAVPKPDVLIVPRIEEPNPSGAGKRFFYRYPGNKRPILRISIDREYSSKETSDNEVQKRLGSGGKTRTSAEAETSPREMTIENSSTNKAVTFTLDAKTGEIVVTTRQLEVVRRDEAGLESTETERKDDAIQTQATKLRQRSAKGQQDCIAMERRLRVLRRRHEREQEEIRKLEDHLTVDDEVLRKRREDPAESRCAKRKEADQNDQREDDRLPSLPKIRRTKEDSQTERDIRLRRDPSTRLNGRSKRQENPTNAKSDNASSGFPDPEIFEISSDEETAGRIVEVLR